MKPEKRYKSTNRKDMEFEKRYKGKLGQGKVILVLERVQVYLFDEKEAARKDGRRNSGKEIKGRKNDRLAAGEGGDADWNGESGGRPHGRGAHAGTSPAAAHAFPVEINTEENYSLAK